jgi:hydrogenase nickel incorporation protein HypA/HybF
MHEFVATQELVRVALEEAAGRRIRHLKVKVGEWAGVFPRYIEYYFPAVAKGTLAEGATVEFIEEKLSGRCAKCGAPFEPKALVFTCEVCGGTELELTAGKGVELLELEVE